MHFPVARKGRFAPACQALAVEHRLPTFAFKGRRRLGRARRQGDLLLRIGGGRRPSRPRMLKPPAVTG